MGEDNLDKTEIPEEKKQKTDDEGDEEIEIHPEDTDLSEKSKSSYGKNENLVNQYRKRKAAENDTGEENDASTIEQLRQIEINRGMQFSGSYIDRATFIIDGTESQAQLTKVKTINLIGEKDEGKFLEWCVNHYQDFNFSMLLALCILDRQPYQTIYQMARELREILSNPSDEDKVDKKRWISKSHIAETLGIIQYSDITLVRGVEQEVEFMRFPVHEQAEQYIRLLVNEFSELRYMLTKYLTEKIIGIYGSRHNYIVISGCMEALAYIGMTDLQFFNDQIIPRLLQKKNIGMDYCVSVLLGKLYRKKECRNFVKTCVVQWGQLKNNPHNLLTALYVCSALGRQEALVCDIWMNVLEQLVDELMTGNVLGKISYMDMLRGLFKSGDRNISYYKGVIHAFHMQTLQAEKNWEREKLHYINTFFLLFLLEDYAGCDVSGLKSNKRDMIWIGIFQKLDEKTGKELTGLWHRVLDSRDYSKESWKLLEDYLNEYQNYSDDDIERLVFFFYHIDRKIGNNQGIFFLKECAEKNEKSIAKHVYEKIRE